MIIRQNIQPPSKSFHSVFLLVSMEMRRMFVTRALYASYVTSSHDHTDRKESGSRLNTCIKTVFPSYGDSHVKVRRSQDRLIFNMRSPILIRWHLYIETAPRLFGFPKIVPGVLVIKSMLYVINRKPVQLRKWWAEKDKTCNTGSQLRLQFAPGVDLISP